MTDVKMYMEGHEYPSCLHGKHQDSQTHPLSIRKWSLEVPQCEKSLLEASREEGESITGHY